MMFLQFIVNPVDAFTSTKKMSCLADPKNESKSFDPLSSSFEFKHSTTKVCSLPYSYSIYFFLLSSFFLASLS
jgi:hypothetical protein